MEHEGKGHGGWKTENGGRKRDREMDGRRSVSELAKGSEVDLYQRVLAVAR